MVKFQTTAVRVKRPPEEVFAEFGRNVGRLRDLVFAILAGLPQQRDCPCPHALDGIPLPFELP